MRQQRREFECLPCRDCSFRRFGNSLPERTHWQACGIGETPHLIDSDLVETAAVTEVQAEPVMGKVGQRGHEIIGRRQYRVAAIRVKQRPVLEVHIAIADEHGKDQPPDKVVGCSLSGLRPEHGGDIGVAFKSIGEIISTKAVNIISRIVRRMGTY